MYSNSTSTSLQPTAYSPTFEVAGPSLLYLLCLVTRLPVMRSKPAYSLPDQPDRAAMRKRRNQRKSQQFELKHLRTVGHAEQSGLESSKAYETPRLVTREAKLQPNGKDLQEDGNNKHWFGIGPQGADAAPIGRKGAAANEKFSVAAFVEKHKKDFEICLSPMAKSAADMRGMIIVIGEDHNDELIQYLIKKVMSDFRPTRGDQFFMEGNFEKGCRGRLEPYELDPDECWPLENDSPAFSYVSKKLGELLNSYLECINYLKLHIPSAREDVYEQNISAYIKFLNRHRTALPEFAKDGFNAKMIKTNKEKDEFEKELDRLMPERDAGMAAAVQNAYTRSALNYVIVGTKHLAGIRGHLNDLPCVFMVPHQIVAIHPKFSLNDNYKKEL